LIPPYLPERLSLLPRDYPVDNSQNPLHKAQKAATKNARGALNIVRQA
jgi:hypothetical protein